MTASSIILDIMSSSARCAAMTLEADLPPPAVLTGYKLRSISSHTVAAGIAACASETQHPVAVEREGGSRQAEKTEVQHISESKHRKGVEFLVKKVKGLMRLNAPSQKRTLCTMG
jgi:hypothetical protein